MILGPGKPAHSINHYWKKGVKYKGTEGINKYSRKEVERKTLKKERMKGKGDVIGRSQVRGWPIYT